MSITVKFYNNNSERNSINKSITLLKSIYGELVNECDMIHPIVRIENTLNNSMIQCNYCEIEVFNRYYFVDSVISLRNGITEIHMTVDPLYTYSSEIQNCVALIDRTELEKLTVNGDEKTKMSNRYLFDDAYRTESGDWIIHHNFQDVPTLTAHTILLTIASAVDGQAPTP